MSLEPHTYLHEEPDDPCYFGARVMEYDRQGQPIGLRTWVRLMDDPDYVVVARTEICGYTVCTDWIGVYSNVHGPPLIFETMVEQPWREWAFERWGRTFTDIKERYPSEDLALAGHWAVVCALLHYVAEMAGDPRRQKMIERGEQLAVQVLL